MSGRADGLNDIFDHSIIVREKVSTNSGTVQQTPVNDKDIANKKYVDDNSATPAGNEGEIQFNKAGALGADIKLLWDETNSELEIGGAGELKITSNTIDAVNDDLFLRAKVGKNIALSPNNAFNYLFQEGEANFYDNDLTTTGTVTGTTLAATGLTAGSIVFSDGTNLEQDNSKLFWDNVNKFLGIGRDDPLREIDMYSSTRAPTIRTMGDGFSAQKIMRTATATNEGNSFLIYKQRGTINTPTAIQINDKIMEYNLYGWDTATDQFAGSFRAVAAATGTSGAVPSKWQWLSDNTSGAGRTVFECDGNRGVVINPNKNNEIDFWCKGDNTTVLFFVNAGLDAVGVGTATPDETLQVVGSTKLGDDNTNYAKFDTDGELTLTGTARVKKEFGLILTDFNPGASGPTKVLHDIFPTYEFTINDDMHTSFELPTDWEAGTDITIEVYWAIDEAYATNNGEVRWSSDWRAVAVGEVISAGASGTVDFGDVDIPATANTVVKTTGTISGASLAQDDLIAFNGARVAIFAGANPTAEPYIVAVRVEYTADKLGEAT